MSGRQQDHPGNAKVEIGNKTLMGYLNKDFDPYDEDGPSWDHFEKVKHIQNLTFNQWSKGAFTLAECA